MAFNKFERTGFKNECKTQHSKHNTSVLNVINDYRTEPP